MKYQCKNCNSSFDKSIKCKTNNNDIYCNKVCPFCYSENYININYQKQIKETIISSRKTPKIIIIYFIFVLLTAIILPFIISYCISNTQVFDNLPSSNNYNPITGLIFTIPPVLICFTTMIKTKLEDL